MGVLPRPLDGSEFCETWKEYEMNEEREGWYKGEGFENMHLQGRRWVGNHTVKFNTVKGIDYEGSIYDAAPTFESYGVPHGSAGFSRRCSQSAGIFGQNMKREYEGESIPSQSSAQQDEPVQQMNSHEAGEEMPTRTLCKKLKTYSRRKLLKGTTSTNPSKSASPAGSTPANEDRTRADNRVADDDTPFSTPANEERTRADNQVAADDTPFSTPANEDRTRADNRVAADDTPFSTPANEDRTRADNQVADDDTPFSTFDKDGVEGTVSPSLANARSKSSYVIGPPDCPVNFDNLEDFFARVSGQIKRAQSLGFSADQSSPMDDKISATQKSTPSVEMLATAKADIERLLIMPSQYMLLPDNCSALSAALSIYAAAPDLSAERALASRKLKENLPHFFVTLRRAQKDQAEYYKESAKNILLIDELRKDQELYARLKDCTDKLEYQIRMPEASLKDAKTKLEAIQEQKLNLARRCFQKSSAFDKLEAEFPVLKEIKKLADSDIARLEESLKDFKSKIID